MGRETLASLTPLPFLPHRFSVRVNSTELFHVDRHMWMTLKGRDGLQGPRERAFHTASVLGNYMVVYGEEAPQCYLPARGLANPTLRLPA